MEVVYSEQEDTTFFFWKLRDDAILEKISFELIQDGDYQPISLSSAPFPSKPFGCEGKFLCFQFQVAGEYVNDTELPPVRSVHVREGVFAGTAAAFERTQTTFGIDPIGVNNNRQIDPHLFDYFSENGFNFRRGFDQSLVALIDDECEPGEEWSELETPFSIETDWADNANGACLKVRPQRRNGENIFVFATFLPSAETTFSEQRYTPPVDRAPVVYGVLLDLEIPSGRRCEQVKETLIGTIDDSFQSRNDESVPLGVYTPTSAETGDELSGCEQETTQIFPIARMIADSKQVELQYAPRPVRVVFVYVNNIDIPPPQSVIEQLVTLVSSFFVDTNLQVFTVAIGSNIIIANTPQLDLLDEPQGLWNETIGWRPIEDDTFRADIRALANRVLPFQTMVHAENTNVDFELPELETDPLRLKVCQSTPIPILGVGPFEGGLYASGAPSVPWPEGELPFFRIALEPQLLLPKDVYVTQRVDLVSEFCTRYCDNPFQTRGGERFTNWARTRKCQWAE